MVAEMLEYFLPVLVTAGDYAREIQPRVAGPGSKSGANAWTRALTDADSTVQTVFEVATLAGFPGVGFYGEEQDQSRNARYFPADADTIVWLDPINGTFLYQNQRPGWDIILSITRRGHLQAAVSYMPVRERFYLAIRGLGAFTGDRHARRIADLSPLTTRSGSGVVVGYQATELLQRARTDWTAFDIVADDDAGRDFDNLNDLFTGRLDAYVSGAADLLDWGAMAFIVANAGGTVTASDGSPTDIFENFSHRSTDLLVAASPEIHQRLLTALKGAPNA